MVVCGQCGASSFQFNDSNYENTNTNTISSPQLCFKILDHTDLATMAKKYLTNDKGFGSGSEKDFRKSKR